MATATAQRSRRAAPPKRADRPRKQGSDAESVRLARKVLRSLGGRKGVTLVRSPGDQSYVRLSREGKTVAYLQARPRAGNELALLRGDPAKIAAALPEGRDPYTRVFADRDVPRAAKALRVALEKNAPRRRREYVPGNPSAD